MKIEKCDGSTIYSDLFVDEEGRTWNFLIREGGSVSVYATAPWIPGHGVAWDSLDGKGLNPLAVEVVKQLTSLEAGLAQLRTELKTVPPEL